MMNKLLGAPRVLGVVFVALLVLAVYLTYATFTKKFADYEEVTLRTTTTGLQLPNRADVKVRGVIVGEVLRTEADGLEGAEITLGIYPDEIDTVPANVTGAIVPKTLFGEKYVSLVVPESGPSGTIQAGSVIGKTEVSTEVEEVLNDLYPLLRTVKPADLNATLTAIATALEGRGDQLGENLETVDSYLNRLNPQIPLLLEDLELTSQVADTYTEILPEVGQILEDTVTTAQTLETKETALNQLLRDVRSFSDTARVFLANNEQALAEVADTGARTLRLLARYAPHFRCLAEGLEVVQGRLGEAFRGFELHIILETLPNQPRAYTPADRPRFGAQNGANCVGLPTPTGSQADPFGPVPNFDDGVDEPTGKGIMRVAPGFGGDEAAFSADPTDMGLLRDFMSETYTGSDDLDLLLAAPALAERGED